MRDYVTRREYDDWINECAALAIACGYPMQDSMINDSTGLVLGSDQYEAFVNGMWSREPYEVFAIFESMNEPAMDGLPKDGWAWAEFGGLCDKLMIVASGQVLFGPLPLAQDRVLRGRPRRDGRLLFRRGDRLPRARRSGRRDIQRTPMPKGDPWPDEIVLAKGREEAGSC